MEILGRPFVWTRILQGATTIDNYCEKQIVAEYYDFWIEATTIDNYCEKQIMAEYYDFWIERVIVIPLQLFYTGIQVYRHTGIQAYRHTGIQATGVQSYSHTVIQA